MRSSGSATRHRLIHVTRLKAAINSLPSPDEPVQQNGFAEVERALAAERAHGRQTLHDKFSIATADNETGIRWLTGWEGSPSR